MTAQHFRILGARIIDSSHSPQLFGGPVWFFLRRPITIKYICAVCLYGCVF